jgi:hypothetical protein
MSEFNLIYFCKLTNKKYEGKRITSQDFILKDIDSGLKIPVSVVRLRKHFVADKKNKNRSLKFKYKRILGSEKKAS